MSREFDGAMWRKSSRSLNGNAECVEVAVTARSVGLRDSKDQGGPILVLDTQSWVAFVGAVKRRGLRP
ncbi:DUF397 domain-containing protein [Micromonospora zingiberis]|uniref:DUF397 domain-containing protein n=1 Tax=Micromonospora zingiberis TaxID=2053011 RepID=A0A4R0GUC0_9ACTN|nr:DUF397 domain-containing protein [Micromonospora zingiberis]TCC00274.1 DUF397 domain-containing protein [Micromonospora zingiberis]